MIQVRNLAENVKTGSM